MNFILNFLDWATDMWENAGGFLNKVAVLGIWIVFAVLAVGVLLIPIGAIASCIIHGYWAALIGLILLVFWGVCFIHYLRDTL